LHAMAPGNIGGGSADGSSKEDLASRGGMVVHIFVNTLTGLVFNDLSCTGNDNGRT
jgi:hypothetical protein